MIIAIDGPAGSGKSTTARAVAQRLRGLYLDTGAMYRAVALGFLRAGAPATADAARDLLPALTVDVRLAEAEGDDQPSMQVLLNGEDVTAAIREHAVSDMASQVSKLAAVRERMVDLQRAVGHRADVDVVVDGRDIGTVVFPQAALKVFLTADDHVRARRRREDLMEKGEILPLEQVLADIRKRDEQDRTRAVSPLRRADDARLLDTTHRTFQEQVDQIVGWAEELRHEEAVSSSSAPQG